MASRSIRRLRGSKREANAREVLSRFAAGELGRAAFCRAEGISPMTLGRWMAEFGANARPPATERFVEVRLDRGSVPSGFELEVSSGRRLRIPVGFDVQELERLLGVIERSPC